MALRIFALVVVSLLAAPALRAQGPEGVAPPGSDPYYAFAFQSTWDTIVDGVGETVISTSGDDTLSASQALPFSFVFFGVSHAAFVADTNGYLSFDTTLPGSDFTNNALPNGALPNDLVAVYWNDLDLDTTLASLATEVVGVAPDRQAVVEWRDISISDASGGVVTANNADLSMQAVLFEATNTIELRYAGFHREFDGTTGNPPLVPGTVGIEDSTGSSGVDPMAGSPSERSVPPWNLRLVPAGSFVDGAVGVNPFQGEYTFFVKAKFTPAGGGTAVSLTSVWASAVSDDGSGNISLSPLQLVDGSRTQVLLGRVDGTSYNLSGPRGENVYGTFKLKDGLVSGFKGVGSFRNAVGQYDLKVKATRLP